MSQVWDANVAFAFGQHHFDVVNTSCHAVRCTHHQLKMETASHECVLIQSTPT